MIEPVDTVEIIDIRGLILTLWSKKWHILGTALLVGLLVFLISSYLVPEQFQATAIITITDRNTWASMEVKGLPQLAESDQLLNQIYEELGNTDLESELLSELTADAAVRSQLILQATAEDPALAANAANSWAVLVVEKLNALYGTSEESLETLEDQVAQAEADWFSAQAELEEYLSESKRDTYIPQLSTAQASLVDTLSEIEHNNLLLSDAAVIEEQLKGLGSNEPLNNGIALSLIILQGRAASGPGDMISISLQDNALPIDLSLSEAMGALEQFITALESQSQGLSSEIAALEEEISSLTQSSEEEEYEIEKLKVARNLAETNYNALAKDLNEGRNLQVQEASSIIVSSSALPPKESISPNILANTGFASVSAALLAMLVILFHGWWVGQDDN